MIYLLQDCYKDPNGEYHDILKIGYSSRSFLEGRKPHYDTHNFGYTFLGEKEGSVELESYLHYRFKDYQISTEWFRYDQEIIDVFNEISEDDDLPFTSDREIINYSRKYILDNLIPNVSKLSDLFLKKLLSEVKRESEKFSDLEYDEEIIKKIILTVFETVSSKERNYFRRLDLADLPQIIGRQRNRNNPFKNNIMVFYRTKRKGEKDLTWEEFEKVQNQRREETRNLLNGFNKLSLSEQSSYISKLKRDSELYVHDFISVSKNTNKPVYNTLIDIANQRAWEVSQKDYQDTLSVTRAFQEAGFESEESYSTEEIIAQDFLDNYFYKTGIFSEKMRMYCEFCDQYKNNSEIMKIIDAKIKDPKYKNFYIYYGTKGCSLKEYRENYLLAEWRDMTKEDQLLAHIAINFKIDGRYTKVEIKQKLAEIYRNLGISKTAKATDLGKYFKLTRVCITLPDKTTKDGFKLGSL